MEAIPYYWFTSVITLCENDFQLFLTKMFFVISAHNVECDTSEFCNILKKFNLPSIKWYFISTMKNTGGNWYFATSPYI